jgi:hydrogenase expression/formation protein HypE
MLPELGKLDRATFDKLILSRLGKQDSSVLIGPRHGVDAAVIDLPGGDVMVVAEDPTFGMPVIMPYFGWAIVHICASDVAVLGVKPRYMTICLMFPPGTTEDVIDAVWKQVDQECRKLDIAIIGGHTGIYPGMAFPLNGGCTVMGIGKKKQITPASNARVGDRVLMTKGPAIEAVGLLACQAEASLKTKLGSAVVEKAKKYMLQMTVVEDALTAAPLAHAMHDATEGGLLNGVYEIAAASGTGVVIHEDKIVIPDEIAAVCKSFNIDPLISISEGTLVITAAPGNSDKIIEALKKKNIDAWDIGEITKSERLFVRKGGAKSVLEPVLVDPFWPAYFSAVEG